MLITEPVKNWTHGDTMGRFMVAVTVDQASDPEAVKSLLLDVAREHPKVLTYPEPIVVLAVSARPASISNCAAALPMSWTPVV